MTRVKCRRRDCAFWDEGVCSRDLITIDEDGCRNFEEIVDFLEEEEEMDWDVEEEEEEEEEEELDYLDEEEDLWEDEEEDEDEGPRGIYRNSWGL
ncbi:MAG: hypothetical protein H5T60_07835 [Anaerolineae bacterium]|nr:hypothetical protein [Anaerolineae bacterium]